MKNLAEHMSVYAAYHRHPVNKGIHFVFVPAIVWSLMVALDQVHLTTWAGIDISAAFAITAVLLVWYLALDFALGVAATMGFTVLLVSAIQLNAYAGHPAALAVVGVVFVASWVFQFVGHGVWEKRRPALVDNLFQALVAPLFLISETAFAMGFKKALASEVDDRMQTHLTHA